MSGFGRCLRLLVAILIALALSACAVNRQLAREADLIVKAKQTSALDCTRADHCAMQTPFQGLADAARQEGTAEHPVHFVNVLENGEDSLLLRIHLIRAARHNIDIQTFIWVNDDAGRLLLDELLAAARRGVHVRVIADQLFSLEDTELLARLATIHSNFEVRIYNPTFHKAVTEPLEFAASILCCFTRFNQRMHNKLFLVDGVYGIAGGRNYENRYFDWDREFDYRDRDVLVTGPMAGREMQESFERFWAYRRAAPLTRLNDVNRRLVAEADAALSLPPATRGIDPMRVAALAARAGNTPEIERLFIRTALRVGEVDYFSDQPAKQDGGDEEDQRLSEQIAGLISQTHSRIVLQTPYLVISKRARKVFRALREQPKPPLILVSTNSLAATDAFYVYALSHKYKKRYMKLGFRIHEFKPHPADAPDMFTDYAELAPEDASGEGVRVGMHAKSIVIDDHTTLIGSHNFDPRSDNYNTESGFIIHDAALAAQVSASILRDMEPQNSWTIAKRPRTNLLHRINNAIGDFSTALPLFDFWPFRYATSYELNPGCQPLPQNDPRFYDCYTAVGDFPGVDLPLKSIYTRIVTAFGAGAVGIL